jgi:hypothetical protein
LPDRGKQCIDPVQERVRGSLGLSFHLGGHGGFLILLLSADLGSTAG